VLTSRGPTKKLETSAQLLALLLDTGFPHAILNRRTIKGQFCSKEVIAASLTADDPAGIGMRLVVVALATGHLDGMRTTRQASDYL